MIDSQHAQMYAWAQTRISLQMYLWEDTQKHVHACMYIRGYACMYVLEFVNTLIFPVQLGRSINNQIDMTYPSVIANGADHVALHLGYDWVTQADPQTCTDQFPYMHCYDEEDESELRHSHEICVLCSTVLAATRPI